MDSHVAVAISGLTADARTLVQHARVEAQNHRFTYDEPMRPESLTQSICDLAMSFGEGGDENKSKMSRPFGVSLLIAGCDAAGRAQLFHTDPSGTYVSYEAQVRAAGRNGVRAGRGAAGRIGAGSWGGHVCLRKRKRFDVKGAITPWVNFTLLSRQCCALSYELRWQLLRQITVWWQRGVHEAALVYPLGHRSCALLGTSLTGRRGGGGGCTRPARACTFGWL